MSLVDKPSDENEETGLRIVRPSQTLRELALEKMRESILNLHFQPGERLIERDLCTRLGVSRTIVREVLRHLESEGLVSNVLHRGPMVAETSADEAQQIYQIRGALEAMAARECALVRDDDVVERLEQTLGSINVGYETKDATKVLNSTTEFYRLLFQSAKHDVAWTIVNSLTVRINQLRSRTIKSDGRNLTGPREMLAIVNAIRDRDGDAAAQAAAEHVRNAGRIAREILPTR